MAETTHRSTVTATPTRRLRAQTRRDTRDTGQSLQMLPGLLGYQLRLAQRAIFFDFAASIREADISLGLFGILVIIEANGGLKQTELAEAVHLDRSSLVPVLDKLEQRGLVERRPSESERRVKGLWLTASGATMLNRLKRQVQEHEARVGARLSPTETRQLIAMLRRIPPGSR